MFIPKPTLVKDTRGNSWAVGDLVMVTKNIYAGITINNGQLARVIEIYTGHGKFGTTSKKLRISFDKHSVENWDPKADIVQFRKKSLYFDLTCPKRHPYGRSAENSNVENDSALNTSIITLAYALTVHKVQGSQYLYTIVYLPPDAQASKGFLNKNLLYTAITRSRLMCIMVCKIETANLIGNTRPSYRSEALSNRLGIKLDRVYKRASMYDESGGEEDDDGGADDAGDDDYDDNDIYSDIDDYDDNEGDDYPSDDEEEYD